MVVVAVVFLLMVWVRYSDSGGDGELGSDIVGVGSVGSGGCVVGGRGGEKQ